MLACTRTSRRNIYWMFNESFGWSNFISLQGNFFLFYPKYFNYIYVYMWFESFNKRAIKRNFKITCSEWKSWFNRFKLLFQSIVLATNFRISLWRLISIFLAKFESWRREKLRSPRSFMTNLLFSCVLLIFYEQLRAKDRHVAKC